MKAVMISVRLEWVHKILSGEKTVEVRKTAPKIETPFKCYIYCTLSGSNELFREILNGDVAEWNRGNWADRKGNVVAEFVCDNIRSFDVPYPAFQKEMDKSILQQSCLTYYQLHRYAYHDKLYGWHISDLKVYDKPKNLCEFFYPCEKQKYPYCFDCEHGLQKGEERPMDGMRHYDVPCGNWVKRPPQSWCYVEEL